MSRSVKSSLSKLTKKLNDTDNDRARVEEFERRLLSAEDRFDELLRGLKARQGSIRAGTEQLLADYAEAKADYARQLEECAEQEAELASKFKTAIEQAIVQRKYSEHRVFSLLEEQLQGLNADLLHERNRYNKMAREIDDIVRQCHPVAQKMLAEERSDREDGDLDTLRTQGSQSRQLADRVCLARREQERAWSQVQQLARQVGARMRNEVQDTVKERQLRFDSLLQLVEQTCSKLGCV